jgi:hypothetical protein
VAEGGGLLNRYRINSPIVGSNPIPSARFSSRTGPKPTKGLRFFEDFKGICEGDRTSETGEMPKIRL